VKAAAIATVAIAACTPPGAPRPATIEIGGTGPAVVGPVAPASPEGEAPARVVAASIAWVGDEREARERARRLGLPLLVWVRAEWAASALQMERTVWNDPVVARAARGFVALRLDVTEAEGDAELLAQRYAVDSMPATILFDAAGRRVAALRGLVDAAILTAALARVSP
jgi:thiol:disulfide interchange protein